MISETFLTNNEIAGMGFTHRWKITYADLSAAATTESVELVGDLVAGDMVESVYYDLITPFDGGATSELTIQVGYDLATGTDDPDAFIAAASVHADATAIANGLNTGAAKGGYAPYEAADMDILFTSTGANISVLTAGEVWVYARVRRAANLPS